MKRYVKKENNKWDNLRLVEGNENNLNKRMYKSNKSGRVGVSWDNRCNKWRARIKYEEKSISLGHFDDFDDACKARKAAELKYGFHPNHGRR